MTIVFRNGDTRPGDYNLFREVPRPGHADYTANAKWLGFNDSRGGGHFSGRLTLPIVAAGTVAKMCGFTINARVTEVGGVSREEALQGKVNASKLSDSELWREVLDKAISERDSVGGIVECTVTGLPVGLGEPFFDSVESLVSHAIFSIPGVRGIEFGDGFAAARMTGSEHNDPLDIQERSMPERMPESTDKSHVPSVENGAGGVNGGLTNGNPLISGWLSSRHPALENSGNHECGYRTDDESGNSRPPRCLLRAAHSASRRGNDCNSSCRPAWSVNVNDFRTLKVNIGNF